MSHSQSPDEQAVAFLGPLGTFSHGVVRRRFHDSRCVVPLRSITDVFVHVAGNANCVGVVPSANSSGGTIYETVENLLSYAGTIFIHEELSLNVRLALLGRQAEPVSVVYSHFAPMVHSRNWLATELPGVEKRNAPSTAEAARMAAAEPGAAALGTREAAEIYGLDVLKFPVEMDNPVANVTQFFVISQEPTPSPNARRSSFIVNLHDEPGSLCSFLEPLKAENINLTRIVSMPKVGVPNAYLFLVDLERKRDDQEMARALERASAACDSMECLGSYSLHETYDS